MSFWAETFSFNGQSCAYYDLMLYDIDSNGSEESEFASPVSISEDTISNHWKPLFYGIKYQNKLTFDLIFGVNQCRIDQGQYLTRSEINNIATWLTAHDQYCWLTIDQVDMENIRYKCFITNLKLISYGKIPWALKATVTCDSPFAYMLPTETTYQISGSTSFSIYNLSCASGYFYPKMEFTRSSGTDFSFRNVTDNSRLFSIEDIPNSITTITIDSANCIITNNQDLNIYDKCNYKWPRLLPGRNQVTTHGYGSLKIICEYPINVGG